MTFDRSAFLDAYEAYWEAEGGTQKGLEAFLETYLERTGLTVAHDASIEAHETFRRRFVGLQSDAA